MPTKKTTKKKVEEKEVVAPVEETTVPEKNEDDEITITDPEINRPKELPLVVKPGKKGWSNDAQEEYARILNGYAYSNPEKFRAKQDLLIKNLKNLADNPQMLAVYQGNAEGDGKLQYKNHITQGANSTE